MATWLKACLGHSDTFTDNSEGGGGEEGRRGGEVLPFTIRKLLQTAKMVNVPTLLARIVGCFFNLHTCS